MRTFTYVIMLLIALTILPFAMLWDWIRDMFNPKSK